MRGSTSSPPGGPPRDGKLGGTLLQGVPALRLTESPVASFPELLEGDCWRVPEVTLAPQPLLPLGGRHPQLGGGPGWAEPTGVQGS